MLFRSEEEHEPVAAKRAPKSVVDKKLIKPATNKKAADTFVIEEKSEASAPKRATKPATTKKTSKQAVSKDDKVLAKVEAKEDEEPSREPVAESQADTQEAKAKPDPSPVEKTVSKPTQPASDYNLYMFGADSCGELGLKKIGFSKKNPTLVPLGSNVKQVACGPMHTIALTAGGDVYSFGCNDEGALGRITQDEDEEATPTVIQLDHKIIKVTAGDSHSAALSDDKKVYVWGNFRDEHGSVGLLPESNGEKTYKPMMVMPETEFKDIASGSNHMLLLDVKGVVYSFGVGEQGQLGRIEPENSGQDNGTEAKISSITAENRATFLKPQPVCLKNVDPQRPFICEAIYAGNYSSFARNNDLRKNRLAGWGLNNYHQLGYKGTKNQVVQHIPKRSTFTCSTSFIHVACGQHHTIFLTKTGRVFAAGRRDYGMLGLGDVKTETVCPAQNVKFDRSVTAIATGINTSFALTDEGKLFSWGMGGQSLGVDNEEDLKHPTEVKRLDGKKVISVSTGGDFTAVLAS